MKFKQVPIYIVIPTYNESESINILLGEIFNLGLANIHVLIVDDDSPDGTSDIAEIFAENNKYSVAFLRRNAKEGLGTAYKDGFQEIFGWVSKTFTGKYVSTNKKIKVSLTFGPKTCFHVGPELLPIRFLILEII